MSADNSLESDRNKYRDEQFFMQWYFSWRYGVIKPLVSVEGFSELLLKDIKGELNKPLSVDEKKSFTERIYQESKWIKHNLNLFDAFLRFREYGRARWVDWAKVSLPSVIEQAVEELKARKILSEITINIQDDLPFVRTTEQVLKDSLVFLLAHDYEVAVPDNGKFEISVNVAKVKVSHVELEINTNLNLKHSGADALESLFEYPVSSIAMGRLLIKVLDGEFVASLHENRISYKILLPIWSLSDDLEKTVRIHIDEGSVELFLGQKLEIVKLVDQKHSFSLPQWEILNGNQNIIAHSATGGGTDSFHMLSFTTMEVGTTVFKIGYAPSYSDELTFYTLQVTVKKQISNMD